MAYLSPALNVMIAAARRSIGPEKCEATRSGFPLAVRPSKD
jgi:hypothetical protein